MLFIFTNQKKRENAEAQVEQNAFDELQQAARKLCGSPVRAATHKPFFVQN